MRVALGKDFDGAMTQSDNVSGDKRRMSFYASRWKNSGRNEREK